MSDSKLFQSRCSDTHRSESVDRTRSHICIKQSEAFLQGYVHILKNVFAFVKLTPSCSYSVLNFDAMAMI
eukprot:9452478-Karenia_brevis.AAC.1